MELLLKRMAALVAAITLGAAGWAECAGWQATPEARMACCSDSRDCPMHRSAESGAGVVTQVQADSCCAASGRNDSTPSPGAFSLSLSAGLVTSTFTTLAPIATPPSFEAWRTHVPLLVGHVPKYVLLSVFLI